jgi:hypothetical protein
MLLWTRAHLEPSFDPLETSVKGKNCKRYRGIFLSSIEFNAERGTESKVVLDIAWGKDAAKGCQGVREH